MTDPQDRRELLPCPFCGGDATTAPASDTDPDLVYAGCMACDVWCDDADAWNRRHPSEGREPVEIGKHWCVQCGETVGRYHHTHPGYSGHEVRPLAYFGAAPTPEPEHPRDEARRRGPLPQEWFGGLGDKAD